MSRRSFFFLPVSNARQAELRAVISSLTLMASSVWDRFRRVPRGVGGGVEIPGTELDLRIDLN